MKLPTLEDRVNRPGITPEIGAVRANPGIYNNGAAEAFGQLANDATRVALQRQDAAQRAQEQADAVTAQKIVTKTKYDWAKQLIDGQTSAPEGAAGFGDQMAKAFADDTEKRLADVPESAKVWAEGQFSDLSGDYGLKALQFEHKAGETKQLTDLYDIANMNANGVRGDFTQLPDAMGRTLGSIAASGLSADNKRVATDTARETLTIAAVEGQIERDPAAAKKTLAGADFKAALSPGNFDKLMGSADLEIKRRADDADRKIREVEADRRVAVADTREEARFQLSALDSGIVPAGYDDTIKKLQALGDAKTATTLQLAKGDVQWTQGILKLPLDQIQAELDRTKEALAKQPDAVLAADLAGRLKTGERVLDQRAKEADDENRKNVSAIRDEAQLALTAVGGGANYQGLDDLIGRAQKIDPGTAQVLRQARDGQAQAIDLSRQAPAEIRKRLDSMQADAVKTGDAQWSATLTQRIDRGEKVLGVVQDGLQKDPLGFAESTGVVKQTDLFGVLATAAQTGDASTLPAAIQARQQANAQVNARYGVQPALLKPAEASAYVKAYATAPSADAKAALLAPLYSLPTNQAQPIIEQLMQQKGGEDIAMIAGIGMDDAATARDIIAGREVAAKVKGAKPDDGADLRGAISGSLGNLLQGNPTARGAIEEAAVDLYAKLSFDAGDNSGTLDADRMSQALARVTGGVISYRGQSFLAPARGMDESAFEDQVLDKIDDRFLASQFGQSRAGAAIHPVYRNGVPMTAEDIRDYGSFQSAGRHSYFVLIDGEPVRDAATGRPFEIDVSSLLPAGAK